MIERVCISMNSVCNLKCTYCYFFLEPDRLPGPDDLTQQELGTILRRIDAYSRRPEVTKRIKVNFVGSGEPLMKWRDIHASIVRLREELPDHTLRWYTVTNGLLLTDRIITEMKEVGLTPSVSLDGPASIHDQVRLTHNGKGSHAAVVRGIQRLRDAGFSVAINTTLSREVIAGLEQVFDFIEEHHFDKVIFDRLVDVPPEHAVSTAEFYATLQRLAELKDERGLAWLEVGNLEAYRRALNGKPDRVCTMFGSTCGAGFNNVIYMQREVYPCGRNFGQPEWVLGRFDDPLELFPRRMAEKVGGPGCGGAEPEPVWGPDCLIERRSDTYDRDSRPGFVRWLQGRST